MEGKDFGKHIISLQKEISKAINRDIPVAVGKTAVDMYKDNFHTEGTKLFGKKWQEVQRRMGATITVRGKVRKNYAKGKRLSDKILHDSGDLQRSVDWDTPNPGAVEIFSDTPYGKYHNEGEGNLPQRRFIGDSPVIDRAVEKEIEHQINKILS
jgi:phage gpG-like protein